MGNTKLLTKLLRLKNISRVEIWRSGLGRPASPCFQTSLIEPDRRY